MALSKRDIERLENIVKRLAKKIESKSLVEKDKLD